MKKNVIVLLTLFIGSFASAVSTETPHPTCFSIVVIDSVDLEKIHAIPHEPQSPIWRTKALAIMGSAIPRAKILAQSHPFVMDSDDDFFCAIKKIYKRIPHYYVFGISYFFKNDVLRDAKIIDNGVPIEETILSSPAFRGYYCSESVILLSYSDEPSILDAISDIKKTFDRAEPGTFRNEDTFLPLNHFSPPKKDSSIAYSIESNVCKTCIQNTITSFWCHCGLIKY